MVCVILARSGLRDFGLKWCAGVWPEVGCGIVSRSGLRDFGLKSCMGFEPEVGCGILASSGVRDFGLHSEFRATSVYLHSLLPKCETETMLYTLFFENVIFDFRGC